MTSIEQAVTDCLKRHHISTALTVALSGGIDSMVLLDVMHRVHSRASGKSASTAAPVLEFDALHVHHGLSPNADAWAEFCQAECDARDVRLTIVRVQVDRHDTGGQGVEGAARRARYGAFSQHAAATILAAQHADDQAETVLHQLLRGTGLAGLAAMGECRQLGTRQTLLRPLLNVARADIEAYAKEHAVHWISDESNDDTTYTRNFIRHQLLPTIESRFAHASAALARTARHAAESAEMLEALAKIDLRWDGNLAHADVLDSLPRARQTNALYHWLKWHDVVPPSHAQLDEWAVQIFRASPTDKPHQAGGHDFVMVRQRDRLHLRR